MINQLVPTEVVAIAAVAIEMIVAIVATAITVNQEILFAVAE
jgi:hypothetical protein